MGGVPEDHPGREIKSLARANVGDIYGDNHRHTDGYTEDGKGQLPGVTQIILPTGTLQNLRRKPTTTSICTR
ncbi:MAG: hypothetical protein GY731_13805 [Gammaproteobacteria bacterium]|nr:hypothetical protein [Gammaproteobacteria bacterium]